MTNRKFWVTFVVGERCRKGLFLLINREKKSVSYDYVEKFVPKVNLNFI